MKLVILECAGYIFPSYFCGNYIVSLLHLFWSGGSVSGNYIVSLLHLFWSGGSVSGKFKARIGAHNLYIDTPLSDAKIFVFLIPLTEIIVSGPALVP